MQIEDRRLGAQGVADELVGGGGGGGCEEVGLVGCVERIREGEPGTEGLVIGRVEVYVVGFECCGREDGIA